MTARLQISASLLLDVREATRDDVPLLLSFIRQMAAFERLTVTATEASLRDALFGDSPAAHAMLAYVGEQPVAYVTWSFSFASMVGRRVLWLDDLFVDPPFRGNGIGEALMRYLATIARRHDCARMEWMVLDWNERALAFYSRLGADPLPDWRICRLDGASLDKLASDATRAP